MNGTNSGLQGSNYTQALKNAGLTAPNSLIKSYDVNGSFGGPIRKDRLWYFATARAQGTSTNITSLYYNQNAGNPAAWTYVPDLSRQAYSDRTWDNASRAPDVAGHAAQQGECVWDQQSICGSCTGRPR